MYVLTPEGLVRDEPRKVETQAEVDERVRKAVEATRRILRADAEKARPDRYYSREEAARDPFGVYEATPHGLVKVG